MRQLIYKRILTKFSASVALNFVKICLYTNLISTHKRNKKKGNSKTPVITAVVVTTAVITGVLDLPFSFQNAVMHSNDIDANANNVALLRAVLSGSTQLAQKYLSQ